MKGDKLLLAIAIFLLAISIVSLGISSYNLYGQKYKEFILTGFVTDTAQVNLTVESTVAINFTTDYINWSSGRVNLGATNATLNTANNGTPVLNGNWTNNTVGLILENIGNVNVSLNFTFSKNASSLLGGTSPSYAFNITSNETNSCNFTTSAVNNHTFTTATFQEVNATSNNGIYVCSNFSFSDLADVVKIDIRLFVPSDSKTGTLSDTITAIASQSAS